MQHGFIVSSFNRGVSPGISLLGPIANPTLQSSRLQYFLIMCSVHSTAIFFCKESTEYLRGIASKLLFSSFITVTVALMTTGMTKHVPLLLL
jgi:hypothetical protein